jgi:protoheme IX farnesyltransferase
MDSALLTELPRVAVGFPSDEEVTPPEIADRVSIERGSDASALRLADLFELTKPRMNFLVLVTTAVGYFMAARGWDDWGRLLHTLLGTALTAGGASVLNQYIERGYDAQMKRTRNRPLPAGRIAPLTALALGAVLAVFGLCELMLFVNPLTASLGAITLGTYAFIYTPLKRWTSLCTVVGAVPGALPIVMGWTAARGEISPEALALFGILFLWQMPHFLAIAILYRDDYADGGFQMLPVVDPHLHATGRQIVFYSLVLIPVTLLPAILHMTGVIYLISAALLGLIFVGFGVQCAMQKQRPAARQLFLASIAYLPLLLASMMLDKI